MSVSHSEVARLKLIYALPAALATGSTLSISTNRSAFIRHARSVTSVCRALVGLVRNIETDEPQAVHRTALILSPYGLPPERLGRLSLGPVGGGAIKLSLDGDVTTGLLIGEGIETVLSASLKFKFRPCWSVLSRSGIAKFPILSGIECVTLAVDNDESGDGQRDAAELVERLAEAGVEAVTLQTSLAKDFNDLIRGQND